MATNPKLPPQRPYRDDHAHMDLVKGGGRRSWWPLVIIVVAAAILIGLIAWLPRAPKQTRPPAAAQVPPQPTGNQVQLSDLNMTTTTTGGAMDITGMLYNNGNTAINAVLAQASFLNINGQTLENVSAPMLTLQADGTTQPFINNPIKPGERRPFEMRIDRVPEGWNRNLPALRLTDVAAQPANTSVPAGIATKP